MKRYYWDRKSDCDCEIVEQHDGAMVDYDEHVAVVAELEARCAALAAEVQAVKSSALEEIEVINRGGQAYCVKDGMSVNPIYARGWNDYRAKSLSVETPDTDSFLAEVRAQGVEMAIEHIEQTICPNHETILSEFADQIRKGGAE